MKKWTEIHDVSSLILYHDEHLIIFNKPNCVPSQPDMSGAYSSIEGLRDFTGINLKLTNRIDRPASGIQVFATSKEATNYVNSLYRKQLVKKQYLAICKNRPPTSTGKIESYLKKTGKNKISVFSTNTPGSRRVELDYKVMGMSDQYFCLMITSITGFQHQIRAQLGSIGCSIKGDVKYGARRGNKDRSIHLHAWQIELPGNLIIPDISLEAPFPDEVLWHYFKNNVNFHL